MLLRASKRLYVVSLLLAVSIMSGSCGEPVPARVNAQGVVSLAPHLTETVCALGQGSRLIGVSSYCDYPPEIASLPKLGGYLDPDLEKIAMLTPELILLPGRHQKVAEFAKIHGIPVVHIHMDALETIDSGVAAIGEHLRCEAEAAALRASIQAELAAVRAAVHGRLRPGVLIVTGRAHHHLDNLFTVGGTSFVSEVVDLGGGDNIFKDESSSYFEASKESVVLRGPDVILEFHAGEKLDEAEKAEFVADWNRLPSLPAVREGRIYVVTDSYALRPGPRVGLIARRLAALLHPEAAIPEL